MAEPQKSGLYERLIALRPAGMKDRQWADAAGLSHQVFTDIRRRGRARHDTIEKLLAVGGHSWAAFDAAGASDPQPTAESHAELRSPAPAFRGPEPHELIGGGRPDRTLARDIPVLGTAEGGNEPVAGHESAATVEAMELLVSEVIEYRARPTSLASRRDIYALYVSGDSMFPRFEQGALIYVDPRRPPAIGDDVIVQLRPTSPENGADAESVVRVLVKRLRKRGPAAFEFEQFNPAQTFALPIGAVARMHRIMRLDELV